MILYLITIKRKIYCEVKKGFEWIMQWHIRWSHKILKKSNTKYILRLDRDLWLKKEKNKIKIKSRIKNRNKFINNIQKIRSKNNQNWMDLLRLAYKLDPKQTSKIVKSISNNDSKINQILKN